jgi:MSHA biogenesis protein MshI
LELQNISAEELVTCNFDMKTDLPVLTLIQDMHNEVCLNIVKDGVLYFSRRLKGFDNLASFSPDELQMGIVDSLCVQIQRSMDYFEAQLRQAPVRQILIKLDTPHLETLKTQIQQAVPATVSLMSVNIDVPEQYNPLGVSYTAIGAALAAAKTVPAEGAQ